MMKEKVVVGFSGGVDSTMTIKLLKENGFEPVAIFLKMFSRQNPDKIKKTANKLGVKFLVKDITDIFSGCIMKKFLDEYRDNKTPNPCINCNYQIKFRILMEIADEMDIEKIATGHYARTKKRKKEVSLLKGIDEKKDQSYFLYRLTQRELSRTIFLLGNWRKEEVKKEMEDKFKFNKAKESQDICFLKPQEKVQDFLNRNLNFEENISGNIENEEGEVLGKHEGLIYYTQGQRKGLELPGGPFYVIDKDLKRNVLKVSREKKHPKLINREIVLKNINWINEEPQENKIYNCKTRYRSKSSPGKIIKENDNWKVFLEEAQWAVARGQSLVAYDGQRVIGGGVISKVK